MREKDTDDLQQELMDSSNLNEFLSDHQEHFSNESVPEILNRLFEKRSISKAVLAKQSGMSEIYLHQIFAGRRNPSRSRLICLCYGLSATLEETQDLLKLCGFARSTPRFGGIPSSCTGWCITSACSTSMTSCFPRMRKRCSEKANKQKSVLPLRQYRFFAYFSEFLLLHVAIGGWAYVTTDSMYVAAENS
mgnify:CR=1 FL=1